jgi:hypothetical protein
LLLLLCSDLCGSTPPRCSLPRSSS